MCQAQGVNNLLDTRLCQRERVERWPLGTRGGCRRANALLGANAALRAAQFERFGRKKIGTRLGPYVFWRARRDSNSRPLGS